MARLGLGTALGLSAPANVKSPYPLQEYSLGFDGVGDYVSVPDSLSLDTISGTTDYTISTWLRATIDITTTWYLMSKYDGAYNGWILSITTGNNLRWETGANGTALHTSKSGDGTYPAALGSWNHVAVTGGGGGAAKLYINGALQDLTATGAVTTSHTTITANNDPLTIGIYRGGTSNTYPVTGNMDEVAVFDRALSDLEIENIYNETLGDELLSDISFDADVSTGATGAHWICGLNWTITGGQAVKTSGGGNYLQSTTDYSAHIGKRMQYTVDVDSISGGGINFYQGTHLPDGVSGAITTAGVHTFYGVQTNTYIYLYGATPTVAAINSISAKVCRGLPTDLAGMDGLKGYWTFNDGSTADDTHTAEVLGSELVPTNTGFDSDTTGWNAVRSSISSEVGGHSGNCLTILKDVGGAGGTDQYAWQGNIPSVVGKTYKLTAWVKSGTSGDEAFELVLWDSGSNRELTGTSVDGWTEYAVYYTATQTTLGCSLRKATATEGTMLFDTVSVKETNLIHGTIIGATHSANVPS